MYALWGETCVEQREYTDSMHNTGCIWTQTFRGVRQQSYPQTQTSPLGLEFADLNCNNLVCFEIIQTPVPFLFFIINLFLVMIHNGESPMGKFCFLCLIRNSTKSVIFSHLSLLCHSWFVSLLSCVLVASLIFCLPCPSHFLCHHLSVHLLVSTFTGFSPLHLPFHIQCILSAPPQTEVCLSSDVLHRNPRAVLRVVEALVALGRDGPSQDVRPIASLLSLGFLLFYCLAMGLLYLLYCRLAAWNTHWVTPSCTPMDTLARFLHAYTEPACADLRLVQIIWAGLKPSFGRPNVAQPAVYD